MKKILFVALAIAFLQACNNPNPGESGTVNDGMNAVDTNGGLADTGRYQTNPSVDTGKMEDRVDTEKRDTFNKRGQ